MIRGMKRQPSNGDPARQNTVGIVTVRCIPGSPMRKSIMKAMLGTLRFMSLSLTFPQTKIVTVTSVKIKRANEQSDFFSEPMTNRFYVHKLNKV